MSTMTLAEKKELLNISRGKTTERIKKACYNCDKAFYPNGNIAPIENDFCICGDKEFPISYVCGKWTEKDNKELLNISRGKTTEHIKKACYNCDKAFHLNGDIELIENKTCIYVEGEYPINFVCEKWIEKR